MSKMVCIADPTLETNSLLTSISVERRKRATSDCPSPAYTAPNALKFSTYCGQELTGRTIYSLGSDTQKNMENCMNERSTSESEFCYGVWYDTSNGTCYQLGRSVYNATRMRSDNVNIAIAPYSQWHPPAANIECPFNDGSHQTIVNGEEFAILCDEDFGGYGDYCPYNLSPYLCPPHADSLTECMEYCSRAHPLCQGVS